MIQRKKKGDKKRNLPRKEIFTTANDHLAVKNYPHLEAKDAGEKLAYIQGCSSQILIL